MRRVIDLAKESGGNENRSGSRGLQLRWKRSFPYKEILTDLVNFKSKMTQRVIDDEVTAEDEPPLVRKGQFRPWISKIFFRSMSGSTTSIHDRLDQ